MTFEIFNDDCFKIMKTLPNKSIDIFICDLPYASKNFGKCIACDWDNSINLTEMWKQFKRLRKSKNTPFFFFCNVKHGYDLIKSNPKFFRYEIAWIKSGAVGFLNAKKMPLKKTEYIYVFYEKLPFYDLSSHKHKYKDVDVNDNKKWCKKGGPYGEIKRPKNDDGKASYDPKLPTNEIEHHGDTTKKKAYKYMVDNRQDYDNRPKNQRGEQYEPPLPNNVLRIKSQRGKHQTQKPVDIYKWILKYYCKKNWKCLDITMGSGSCGVACKEMGVNFIGIEKDSEIFKVAKDRLKNGDKKKKVKKVKSKDIIEV